MKRVLIWSALITAGILVLISGCIPVPIPIDLGNLGIEPQVFEIPAGSSSTLETTSASFTVKAEDVKNAQQKAGVPGTVHFHNIEVSGKITVEGDLRFVGFIRFALEEPSSTPTTGDVTIRIDTSQESEYSFPISADDSDALRTALNRINNGEDVTLWVIFGQNEYESTTGATVTVTITNVRLWVTWTAW
ncbi:hypothetical protein THMA_0181 [Thermotoga maritima MSB8]|uniref:Lipoprotein n=1 Tax=Thermotoga maritima (strain ATCC 43589 / DSM 3109 / JCM 10099 / NBRC 100826 / MSB8) TaxID=243274 RepID=Q9WY24_THEMA|nr:hypothetical protein [Thermotoga maritima]AAD35273.1 hypothetical protein TM_0180 [Thermotoga maritima MSB8]AGL49104.1 hypothetical protein Tmari_0178 [Thermotoga maritima MSB8]AHD18053.1 hypothetical protein THEMA_03875 [Thermotoga maritima MSB8]AKE26122.1 hypothetical protein THMC_0181 [Thermotoga maritima]AKE27985.1 hypothetical protein THMA_0181 [Thermotoga maritima MSB8]